MKSVSEAYLFILSPESTWSRDLFIFESIEAQILWKKAKIMALLKQSYLWIHVYFFSKFSGIYLFSHSKHMPIANALDKKSSFLKPFWEYIYIALEKVCDLLIFSCWLHTWNTSSLSEATQIANGQTRQTCDKVITFCCLLLFRGKKLMVSHQVVAARCCHALQVIKPAAWNFSDA